MLTIFAPYGHDAASARVRVYQWLHRLPMHPNEVHPYTDGSDNSPRTLLLRLPQVVQSEVRARAMSNLDRVLVHREISPLSRGGLETRIAKDARMSILDFDDALFLDDRSGVPGLLTSKGPKTRRSISAYDRVVAGNRLLAEWASRHVGDVRVVPSCVDLGEYVAATHQGRPTVGWIGSAASENHLAAITPILMEMISNGNTVVKVIGSKTSALPPNLERHVLRVPWHPHSWANELATLHVGLMPLRSSKWVDFKCGYKLLQYGAAGIPAVASPRGVNGEIAHELGHLTAETPRQWKDALNSLLRDSAFHEDVAARVKQRTAQLYSFDAWSEVWRSAVID